MDSQQDNQTSAPGGSPAAVSALSLTLSFRNLLIALLLAAIIGLAGGYVAARVYLMTTLSGSQPADSALYTGPGLHVRYKPPMPGVGPTVGDAHASIAVVEFTDYECALCGRYFSQAFPQIDAQYIKTGKVRYEVRNAPISSIHPHAQIAAEAAMCAAKQDAFWKMHDALFLKQAVWSALADPVPAFKQMAADLKLDAAAFATCLDSHETLPLILTDSGDAKDAGVDGTPSFWVFGHRQVRQINGAYSYETFQQIFDSMLKK